MSDERAECGGGGRNGKRLKPNYRRESEVRSGAGNAEDQESKVKEGNTVDNTAGSTASSDKGDSEKDTTRRKLRAWALNDQCPIDGA